MTEPEIRQEIAHVEADNRALDEQIKSLQDARRRNGERLVMLHKELDGQMNLLPLAYEEAVILWGSR